jgi:hypothetical protein
VATVTGDIGSPGLADEVIAAAVSRWGRVDILVNDAASYPDGTLLEMPGEAWEWIGPQSPARRCRLQCLEGRGRDHEQGLRHGTRAARDPG